MRMRWAGIGAAAVLWATAAGVTCAEPVRNGNDLGLSFVEGDAAAKKQLQTEHVGKLHTFRHLAIRQMVTSTNRPPLKVVAVEPSSDMVVVLSVESGMSLDLAKELGVGDAVAARGRLVTLGGQDGKTMEVDPALLQFKDRPSPKAGKELLREVDKTAR